MKVTKETSQMIAELYIEPVLAVVDSVLQNPIFLKIAEATSDQMEKNQNTARAVSGIMLDMADVDKREVELKMFKAAIELLRVRDNQRKKTIQLAQQKENESKIKAVLGF